MKQVKHILPKSSFRTLYFSLIRAHFSHGIVACENAEQSTILHSIIPRERALLNSSIVIEFNSHRNPYLNLTVN